MWKHLGASRHSSVRAQNVLEHGFGVSGGGLTLHGPVSSPWLSAVNVFFFLGRGGV